MSADLLYIPSFTVPNTFLKTNSVLSSTLQKVSDNAGNDSVLSLGTTNMGIASHVLFDWTTAPTGAATKTAFFFDATGRMAWRNGTGFLRTFDATGITADRVYTLPNATTTLAGLAVSNTFTERQLLTPPSLTGSSALSSLNITQTWNTTGNPTAIFLNVTNTASGTTANLMDLQIGGVSAFKFAKTGFLDFNGVSGTGGISFGNNQSKGIFWSGSNSSITIYQQFTSHQFNVYNGSSYAKRALLDNTGLYVGTGTIKASASLEVESTTQGFLPPRMTTTQINAIATPAEGLQIYNTTINHMCFYMNGAWVKINHSAM